MIGIKDNVRDDAFSILLFYGLNSELHTKLHAHEDFIIQPDTLLSSV